MGFASRKVSTTAGRMSVQHSDTSSMLMPEKLPADQLCRFTMSASFANVIRKSVTEDVM